MRKKEFVQVDAGADAAAAVEEQPDDNISVAGKMGEMYSRILQAMPEVRENIQHQDDQ